MATVNAASPKVSGATPRPAHSYFSDAERARMMKEDSLAFGIVSAELVAIVSLGFVLIGITLCTILLHS